MGSMGARSCEFGETLILSSIYRPQLTDTSIKYQDTGTNGVHTNVLATENPNFV